MGSRYELNKNLAQMLKGGVIMDVTTPEQAKIAKAAGVCAVPPSAAVTFAARSPKRLYSQSPGQDLLANQRWTVSTISSDSGL